MIYCDYITIIYQLLVDFYKILNYNTCQVDEIYISTIGGDIVAAEERKRITFSLDMNIYKKLERIAKKENRTLPNYLQTFIINHASSLPDDENKDEE